MKKIVECVPNISDGVNREVYEAVAQSAAKVKGVELLDIDPGVATNRTVITFAGEPEAVLEGAFQLFKTAKEMIDMRNHKGEHPRMGAVDVCPFVPVSGVTMEECVALSKRLGERVGKELGVWVYLYEFSASKEEWRSLSNIRKGEYESLLARVGKSEWHWDYGPEQFDPKFGAVAIGARKFLVAYNINVNATNKKWAQDVSFNIRESGRSKRESYPDGEIIRNGDGTPVNVPGLYSHCKATAWVIPEYNRAQVTMNLTDTDVTPLHDVFDEVERQIGARGSRVTGSEIVGLVPLKVIVDAGKHYLKKQGFSQAVSEKEIINSAIISLGLNDVSKFDPQEKIVEFRLRKGLKKEPLLVEQTVADFCDTLASDAPAPGGGSIAALCGALGASLSAMVTNLTHGKTAYRNSWDEMEEVGVKGQQLKLFFLDALDKDTEAFNQVMAATRLPKESEADRVRRQKAIEEANQLATTVPLSVLEKTVDVLPLLEKVAQLGNKNCASDVGVGAYCALTCAEGAAMNVRINLKSFPDGHLFKQQCMERLEMALQKVRSSVPLIVKMIEKHL